MAVSVVVPEGAIRRDSTAASSLSRDASRFPVSAAPEAEHATHPAEARDWLLPGADEFFRAIYTHVYSGANEVLAMCSALTGEGKTTLALGLGVTIAQDFPERRVLVVETDIWHAVLAEDFGLSPTPGLLECLALDRPITAAYRHTTQDNLDLVLAGGPCTAPSRLLRSSRMAVAVDAMRQSHDLVILDLPAVLESSDASPLADLADGIVFVARSGATPRTAVQGAIARLDQARLRGTVLNGAGSAIPRWLRHLMGV